MGYVRRHAPANHAGGVDALKRDGCLIDAPNRSTLHRVSVDFMKDAIVGRARFLTLIRTSVMPTRFEAV